MKTLDKETKALVIIAIVFAGIFSLICFTALVGGLIVGILWLLDVTFSSQVQTISIGIAITLGLILSLAVGKGSYESFISQNAG